MRERGSSSLTPHIFIISGLRECGSSSLTPLTLIFYPNHCGSMGAIDLYTKKSGQVF